MQAEYISTTETAKMIRKALKAAFPGVKFSVRSKSYTGGSSIDVSWTDGPTTEQVDPIAKQFAGGGFDGMIDLQYSVRHWLLPDGSIEPASSIGTTGSHGVVPGFDHEAPCEGARLVQFGGTYIFTNRKTSDAFVAACKAAWQALGMREQTAMLNKFHSLHRCWADNGDSEEGVWDFYGQLAHCLPR